MDKYSRCFPHLYLIVFFYFCSAIVHSAYAAGGGAVKVLPLGDSITHGFGGNVSYRRDLWFTLQSEGYNVDFVGSLDTFSGTVPESLQDFDLDHEGHSGFEVGQLDSNITGWMQSYDADIVLLHAGTNDINRGQSIASTLVELSSLIVKLRAHNPNIIIFVARIIPGSNLDTLPFNLELDNWVSGENSTASPVVLVDQHSDYDGVLDNSDTLHPNPQGEAKIAARWFAAIQSVLTAGNERPTANAGANIEHPSFADPLLLSGVASDDGLPSGSTVSVLWSQVSGPGNVSFTTPNNASTSATFPQEGIYTLRFSVSDSEITISDEVDVRVGINAGSGPVLSGISGHWRLDENGGTQALNSVNSAESGVLRNLDESNWGRGVYNSGLCLDGESGQEVSIPLAGAGLKSESLSLSGWVQVDSTFSVWGVWIAGQGDNYGLFVRNTGALVFYFYQGSTWRGVSMAAPALFDGGWHHVAGTFDASSGEMAVYLDGARLNATSTSNTIAYEIGDGFSLGSMRGQRNFKGCLDEIQVYGRGLSEQEVQQLSEIGGTGSNQAPLVDVGSDQSLQLPVMSTQIVAQISDDGEPSPSALTYTWSQRSGPGTAIMTPQGFSNGMLPTDITVDVEGTYVLRLTVSDGELSSFDELSVVLSPAELGNQAPLVDVGSDQSLQLPVMSTQIVAQISDDGEPSPSALTYTWSQRSGPGTAIMTPQGFSNGMLPTDITVDVEGTYVLRLTVSDGELSSFDELSVVLTSAPVGGGPVLSGISGHWRLDENGGTQALNSVNSAESGVLRNLDESNWGPGVYNSGLCLDGESGQEVSIPLAGAGLKSESLSLSGWVQVDSTFSGWGVWIAGQGDNYGLFIRNTGALVFYFYQGSTWRGVSMAAPALFDGGWHHVAGTFDASSGEMAVYLDGARLNATSTSNTIAYEIGDGFSLGSMRGQRNFKGCLDEIQVYGRGLSEQEVQQLSEIGGTGSNQAPLVDVGSDQSLQLPVMSTQIVAQISDDGEPSPSALTYTWSQRSGPGTAIMTPQGFSNGMLPTDITVDVEGTYVLRLTVSDGELSSFDELSVVLSPAELGNQAPLVDVGSDQSLQLPVMSTQIVAQISDDGEPSPSALTYTWSQRSGPGTAIMTPQGFSNGMLPTDITVDVEGTYVLRLTVSDGELSSFDELSVVLTSAPVGGGPVLSGISGHWRLDENGGTQALNSVNSAESGVLRNLDESNWGPGVYNSGLCLDGESGQEVSIPLAGAGLKSESLSLSGWVQVDSTFSGWGVWIAGQGDNYGLFVRNTGALVFYFYQGSTWRGVSMAAPALFDGGWHHVAGTFDASSGEMAVYLDGARLNATSTSNTIAYEIGDGFSLGSMRGQRNFKGCLDEIQVYGRGLSEQEVQQLYIR